VSLGQGHGFQHVSSMRPWARPRRGRATVMAGSR
jgi:hypothetical protein